MHRKPIVTIGIPVFNEERYIKETLLSAINQTYPHLKILLSDNCSTDNTFLIAKEIAKGKANIEIIKHSTNLGANENFEYVQNKCSTPYFMWLGGHDIIDENYIKNSIEILETTSNIVMTYHNAVFFSRELNLENLQGDASSYIDTMAYTKTRGRMYEVVTKLAHCTAIHGVFRSEVLKSIEIKKDIIGPDNLVLFETAAFGHIKRINKIGYFRRTMHENEDQEQRMKRYQKFKIIEKIKSNPNDTLAENHILFLTRTEKLTFLDKLKLIRHIIASFHKQYYVSKTLMIRQIIKLIIFNKKMKKPKATRMGETQN